MSTVANLIVESNHEADKSVSLTRKFAVLACNSLRLRTGKTAYHVAL